MFLDLESVSRRHRGNLVDDRADESITRKFPWESIRPSCNSSDDDDSLHLFLRNYRIANIHHDGFVPLFVHRGKHDDKEERIECRGKLMSTEQTSKLHYYGPRFSVCQVEDTESLVSNCYTFNIFSQ